MFFFVLLDAPADEDQDLAVGGPSFIVRHDVELVQELRLDPDGKTFRGHKITPKQIYYVFILERRCVILSEMNI